jgi:hypothetical protein
MEEVVGQQFCARKEFLFERRNERSRGIPVAAF